MEEDKKNDLLIGEALADFIEILQEIQQEQNEKDND